MWRSNCLLLAAIVCSGQPICVADDPVALVAVQAQSSIAPDSATAEGSLAKPKAAKAAASSNTADGHAPSTDEDQLLQFVDQHQPDLLKLLKFMSKKQPTQYAQALKDLSRTAARLSNLEKKDKDLFDVELALWKTRSSLRMLVAELAVVSDDARPASRQQLRALVRQELELEHSKLKLDQLRAQQRLDQINSQLDEWSGDEETRVSKAIKAWESRVAKPRAAKSKTQS